MLASDDVDDLAATLRTELHRTSGKSEQGVVTTTTDVDAGVEVRATLANKNFAGENLLAAEALYAETLCVRVATVTEVILSPSTSRRAGSAITPVLSAATRFIVTMVPTSTFS